MNNRKQQGLGLPPEEEELKEGVVEEKPNEGVIEEEELKERMTEEEEPSGAAEDETSDSPPDLEDENDDDDTSTPVPRPSENTWEYDLNLPTSLDKVMNSTSDGNTDKQVQDSEMEEIPLLIPASEGDSDMLLNLEDDSESEEDVLPFFHTTNNQPLLKEVNSSDLHAPLIAPSDKVEECYVQNTIRPLIEVISTSDVEKSSAAIEVKSDGLCSILKKHEGKNTRRKVVSFSSGDLASSAKKDEEEMEDTMGNNGLVQWATSVSNPRIQGVHQEDGTVVEQVEDLQFEFSIPKTCSPSLLPELFPLPASPPLHPELLPLPASPPLHPELLPLPASPPLHPELLPLPESPPLHPELFPLPESPPLHPELFPLLESPPIPVSTESTPLPSDFRLSDVPIVDPVIIKKVDDALRQIEGKSDSELTQEEKVWRLAASGGSTQKEESVDLDFQTKERLQLTLKDAGVIDKVSLRF